MMSKSKFNVVKWVIWGIFTVGCTTRGQQETDSVKEITSAGIDISSEHPQYWQYNGETLLLLGGSDEDNLFQHPELDKQLDLLEQAGGNYVRNTLSCRDSGNVWPFGKSEEGLYNLDTWNEEYWNRLEHFLQATSSRDIVAQMEIWATFDFYRDIWEVNPFNPKNNVNYNTRRSKLPEVVDSHPIFTENNFFRSVPDQMALMVVLEYQQKFVDKVLEHSLNYDNVLYCMDNETSVTAEWGRFWADYIRKVALENGKKVHTTEMWDPWDLHHVAHRETMDHPEIYTFVDISQNNHITGDEHWENGLAQIEHLEKINALRPLNNVKIYGNDGGRHKTTRNAIESFCQNVLMGTASARFHRPPSGQGINQIAQACIKSLRDVEKRSISFFEGTASNDLLLSREANEAFCRNINRKEFIIYFPAGGTIDLDLKNQKTDFNLYWLDVLNSSWSDGEKIEGGIVVTIDAPAKDHQIALIQTSEES